jgi:hypothetical protein
MTPHEVFEQHRLFVTTSYAVDEVIQLALAEIQDAPKTDDFIDIGGKRWHMFTTGLVSDGSVPVDPLLFAYNVDDAAHAILMLTVRAAAGVMDQHGHLDREAATQVVLHALSRVGRRAQ